jgi:hypothetical protein
MNTIEPISWTATPSFVSGLLGYTEKRQLYYCGFKETALCLGMILEFRFTGLVKPLERIRCR